MNSIGKNAYITHTTPQFYSHPDLSCPNISYKFTVKTKLNEVESTTEKVRAFYLPNLRVWHFGEVKPLSLAANQKLCINNGTWSTYEVENNTKKINYINIKTEDTITIEDCEQEIGNEEEIARLIADNDIVKPEIENYELENNNSDGESSEESPASNNTKDSDAISGWQIDGDDSELGIENKGRPVYVNHPKPVRSQKGIAQILMSIFSALFSCLSSNVVDWE